MPASTLRALRRRLRTTLLDALVRRNRTALPAPARETVRAEASGAMTVRLLIGTMTGLLLYEEGRVRRLLPGKTYGITRHGGRWYVFRQHQLRIAGVASSRVVGHVVSFVLREGDVADLRVELYPLDSQVHQIDAYGDRLYLTDTANNRMLRYDLGPAGLANPYEAFPSGRLHRRKSMENYVHLNSVFCTDEEVYVVYHNQTRKTGRPSEIVVLDPATLALERRIPTTAKTAHNVYPSAEGLLYLSSFDGKLYLDDRVVVELPSYLRGLAVTEDRIFVGGSGFVEREERDRTKGSVFAFDRATYREVGRLEMEVVGSIYEVRAVDAVDYGMSAARRTAASAGAR